MCVRLTITRWLLGAAPLLDPVAYCQFGHWAQSVMPISMQIIMDCIWTCLSKTSVSFKPRHISPIWWTLELIYMLDSQLHSFLYHLAAMLMKNKPSSEGFHRYTRQSNSLCMLCKINYYLPMLRHLQKWYVSLIVNTRRRCRYGRHFTDIFISEGSEVDMCTRTTMVARNVKKKRTNKVV